MVKKDNATAERMAAIEEQRRQLAIRLGDELADKARQAQQALQRHQEDEQHRAAYFQVPIFAAPEGGKEGGKEEGLAVLVSVLARLSMRAAGM